MPRNRTPRQWREILDAFDRSDLSQAEFCRRRGLALATFRYHRARVELGGGARLWIRSRSDVGLAAELIRNLHP